MKYSTNSYGVLIILAALMTRKEATVSFSGVGLIAGGGSKSGHGSHTFLINKTSLTQFAPTAPGWREKVTGQENT